MGSMIAEELFGAKQSTIMLFGIKPGREYCLHSSLKWQQSAGLNGVTDKIS